MAEDKKGAVTPWNSKLAEALRQLPPVVPPPPVVRNLWYNGKTIKIDGWTFESCRFDNCTLIVHSPFFTLKNCHFDKTNFIQWGMSLIPVIQLYNHQAGADPKPPFAAVRNADGTVTIGG